MDFSYIVSFNRLSIVQICVENWSFVFFLVFSCSNLDLNEVQFTNKKCLNSKEINVRNSMKGPQKTKLSCIKKTFDIWYGSFVWQFFGYFQAARQLRSLISALFLFVCLFLSSHIGHDTVVVKQWSPHSIRKVISSHSSHNTVVEWSSHSGCHTLVIHTVRHTVVITQSLLSGRCQIIINL